jgi:predicted O-methyltransferase YrrM
VTLLRSLYNRHLRDTAAGELARSLKRSAARSSEQLGWRIRDLPRRVRATTERVGMALSRRRHKKASHGADTSTTVKNIWYRARYVGRYYRARIGPAWPWLFASRETSNFTYDLTERNRAHLAAMIALVFKLPITEVVGYIDELLGDEALKASVIDRVNALGRGAGLDASAAFGRRIGWYAIARALKPNVVIETGVEKGLGAVVLCAALLRNREEGHQGRYYGTDIDLAAGMLLAEPYRSMGEILYGDSLESLAKLDVTIDLFINDSDHSHEYEAREYRLVAPKLSERAVIIADNAHVTDELYRFAQETGRQFLFFREEPEDHWYLGAGIGLAFR